MNITTTTWSPDTCKCVIEYEWDRDLPAENRVHTAKTIVSSCSEHNGLQSDKHNHFDKVLNENQRKNKVDGQLKTISQLSETVIQDDGSSSVIFKKGIGFNYSWSGIGENRVLSISVFGTSLTNQQKNAVQSWCDSNLGIGKVIIK